jgi:hypothetical protein
VIYSEFDTQMARLASTYGPRAYPDERKSILWKEFQSMAPKVFERIVDKLIGENSMPPMLPKFREAAAVAREKNAAFEKEEYRQGTQAALEGVSLKEFIRRTIDSGKAHELDGLVKLFGLEWVERKYREAKKLHESNIQPKMSQLFGSGS